MLYGCEAWSLALREERSLRVCEKRILRRIRGPKRDENWKWRRLHNEKLHNLYRSPKSRRLRGEGYVARMVEGMSAFKILIGTPTGKIPLRKPRRGWKDIFECTLKK